MKKNVTKGKLFPIVGWSLATLWTIVFLTFLFWMLITSVKSVMDFMHNPLWLPSEYWGGKSSFYGYNFKNYSIAFDAIKIVRLSKTYRAWDMIGNSMIYAFGCALCAIIPPCLVSYLLAKYNYIPYVASIWAFVLVIRYIPISASMAACITYLQRLHLYDSMFGVFLWTLNGFEGSFLLLYATWKNVSTDYRDAAFIDGAGHFKAMLTVMVPMIIPILIILFVQNFISRWNDYMGPMVYLPSYPTLSYGAWRFQFDTSNPLTAVAPTQMAGLLMLSAPMFVLFLFFRKKMMNTSMTIGGLKG